MTTININYPDNLFEILMVTALVGILLLITLRSASKRGLPWYYMFWGLLVYTGSVYVATLDKVGERDVVFREKTKHSFKRNGTPLMLLTFMMVVALIVGPILLFSLIAAPFMGTPVYVNGELTGGGIQGVLLGISMTLYMIGLALFHIIITRRNIKHILKNW